MLTSDGIVANARSVRVSFEIGRLAQVAREHCGDYDAGEVRGGQDSRSCSFRKIRALMS